jgi:hypothetical protein
MLAAPCREATKRDMRRVGFPAAPHTHVPVGDAVEQGEL